MKKCALKLEASTLDVLKHFATINPTLHFRKGSTLKTMSKAKSLAAKVTLKQHIPRDFAISDLGRFIDAVSLFEHPEITLDDSFCTIKYERATVWCRYADDRFIQQMNPDKDFKFPEVYFSFKLAAADFVALKRSMSVFGCSQTAVAGDGKKMSLKVLASDNKSDVFNLVIADTGKHFKAVIAAENLKMLPQDYQVLISDKGMAHLKSVDGAMEYWTAVSTGDSEFGTKSIRPNNPTPRSSSARHPRPSPNS